MFDLQMHSTKSDGTLSPRELVSQAKERGVSTIALTDHDTTSGVKEALAAGKEYGIEVIPAIEISCHHGPLGLHILGYGIDHQNAQLLSAMEKSKETRIERAKEMVSRLKEQGFEVEYENVAKRAGGDIITRPHIAFEILENPENKKLLGSISTKGDFIRTFLSPGKPAYAEGEDPTAEEAIKLIHGAGGVAVWSHPAVHFAPTYEGLEKILKDLVAYGLDGIEMLNSSMTEAESKILWELSEKYQLLRTAGSDFERPHPPGMVREGGSFVGDYPTFGFPVDEILPRLKEAMTRRSR